MMIISSGCDNLGNQSRLIKKDLYILNSIDNKEDLVSCSSILLALPDLVFVDMQFTVLNLEGLKIER